MLAAVALVLTLLFGSAAMAQPPPDPRWSGIGYPACGRYKPTDAHVRACFAAAFDGHAAHFPETCEAAQAFYRTQVHLNSGNRYPRKFKELTCAQYGEQRPIYMPQREAELREQLLRLREEDRLTASRYRIEIFAVWAGLAFVLALIFSVLTRLPKSAAVQPHARFGVMHGAVKGGSTFSETVVSGGGGSIYHGATGVTGHINPITSQSYRMHAFFLALANGKEEPITVNADDFPTDPGQPVAIVYHDIEDRPFSHLVNLATRRTYGFSAPDAAVAAIAPHFTRKASLLGRTFIVFGLVCMVLTTALISWRVGSFSPGIEVPLFLAAIFVLHGLFSVIRRGRIRRRIRRNLTGLGAEMAMALKREASAI